MADPTNVQGGQAAPAAAPEGAAAPAPAPVAVEGGQVSSPAEPTSTPAPAGVPEPSFFDYETIKDNPELVAAYKEMQGAFTKKMQGISGKEQAIQAYEAFQRDPHGTLRAIATQLGYNLNQQSTPPAPQHQSFNQPGNGNPDLANWTPESWNEVVNVVGQHLMSSVMQQMNQKMEPYLSELKEVRKSTLETMLDQNCPDWRTYESTMMENLTQHPTLVNDPVKLYSMSVPAEVLESRATQRALKKLQQSAQAQPSGGSSTVRQNTPQQRPGSMKFDDAVKFAKAQLASQGITGPWSQQ